MTNHKIRSISVTIGTRAKFRYVNFFPIWHWKIDKEWSNIRRITFHGKFDDLKNEQVLKYDIRWRLRSIFEAFFKSTSCDGAMIVFTLFCLQIDEFHCVRSVIEFKQLIRAHHLLRKATYIYNTYFAVGGLFPTCSSWTVKLGRPCFLGSKDRGAAIFFIHTYLGLA